MEFLLRTCTHRALLRVHTQAPVPSQTPLFSSRSPVRLGLHSLYSLMTDVYAELSLQIWQGLGLIAQHV